MSEEPNYPVLELEAENDRLKDEIIEVLKKRVDDLEREAGYLRGLIKWKQDETDQGSHMVAPPLKVDIKPRLRTVSEVALLLEKRSRNIAEAKISAEDLKDEDKVS